MLALAGGGARIRERGQRHATESPACWLISTDRRAGQCGAAAACCWRVLGWSGTRSCRHLAAA